MSSRLIRTAVASFLEGRACVWPWIHEEKRTECLEYDIAGPTKQRMRNCAKPSMLPDYVS